MATNVQSLSPWVHVATVKGVVVTRRDARGLRAGRALNLLKLAKNGFISNGKDVFISNEKEVLEWKSIGNACVTCLEPSPMEERWTGPGKDKQ